MSRLEELIQEYCPDGVEYKELGEYLKYEQPQKYLVSNTDYDDSYNIPVLTAGQSFILGYTNDNDGIYLSNKSNPVIIFDDFTTAFRWIDFNFKVKSSAIKMLKPVEDVNFKYLYYAMSNIKYSPINHSRQWISTYSKFKVPVPPLPVQEEIVRILDNFTELTKELTKELEARKKQYEYYRDYLLIPNTENYLKDKISFIKLGEIADIGTGSSNTNEALEEGNYPFYVRSQDIKRKNEFEFDETAIITSGDGVGVGKIIHYVEGKYALHQRAYRIHIKDERIIPKYFYHYMKATFLRYINKTAVNSSVTSLRRKMLTDYEIPIPSLNIQKKIIKVLDNFEDICSNLNIGLPAEIEARQKQYNFYRDVLLNFDKHGMLLAKQASKQASNR